MSETGLLEIARLGGAGIIVLLAVVGFAVQVIRMLDRRMGEIVTSVRDLVQTQHNDSRSLADSMERHDDRSQDRHEAVIRALNDHHTLAVDIAARLNAHSGAFGRRPPEGG